MSSVAKDLVKRIDPNALPAHIAVIMDGNGRWARRRKLPRVAGHRAGIQSVREVLESSASLGVEALTLFAFSTENWKRPRTEVQTLMDLLREYLNREIDNLDRNNIRFGTLGDTSELSPVVQQELDRAIDRTRFNGGLRFNVALNYVTDTFWPDFRKEHLYEAIIAFQKRERRYGGLAPPALVR